MNEKCVSGSILITAIVWALSLPTHGGELPTEITKCKVGDNDCVRDKIQEICRKYPKGNPSFAFPDISALRMENITITRANDRSPLQLNFKFLHLINYGIETIKILKTTGWTKDPKIIEMEGEIPLLRLVGHYQADGKILLFNLNGEGEASIELADCRVQLKARVKLEKRSDGKNYLKIVKLTVTLEPKKSYSKLENLIKGNKELSDSVNDVINENWRDVWNELRTGTNDVTSQIYFNIIGNVLDVLSYDDFFAE
ncbi:circadian clock-controlled protein daywake [Stomoxys calcitrans]|uniref:Hemolymph juvenile hormone binding protein n=1 Tax=Stomoxys calcitrans TaxID=35570 RepID=A0A1I8PH72_STOCA|nr:circadian clock-controlled protein daywake [Stomoxys calcitrans]